ncbi:hypothetical protein C8P63_104197 [Melghirimyces profundicolus]|uniref:Uncharacterized protein n=1 Tax=Melghirimyces profundicolus TaxID=1242148 RepID=A0A2T6C4V3_9BACL|nr:hypothetical protein [Melghirimyces profundicolus]PTX63350.1 hypothetical protein C8P63_104197 [Melghirimyces profundicolus]
MYGMVPPPYHGHRRLAPHRGETSFIPEYAKKALHEHLTLMRQVNQKLDRIESLLRQK